LANYGIPYQGSKDKVIHKIATLFPKCEHFVDLFGGGFSVSHFMLAHRKCRVHYNEIEPGTVKLVLDAIAGRYNYDVFRPEWITREMFEARKATCAYTRIIWSFGNNQKGYIFGDKRESNIRSLHQVVVFNEWDDNARKLLGCSSLPSHLSIRGRRLAVRKLIVSRMKERRDLHELEQLERLQQLEQLERLQQLQQLEQLERLERLERLTTSSLSYEQVPIPDGAIVYCDPPYKGTAGYTRSFDHEAFWDWVRRSPHRIFVSEYTAPPDFQCVMALNHRATNSQTSTKAVEKVFTRKQL
jgi:hypothetical protein